ncbi:MAG: tetratricopeptide repeat protein [Bacteroidales bacterium]|nr:tetratricopeptide repeat protein [Bacteroidales bacterium]
MIITLSLLGNSNNSEASIKKANSYLQLAIQVKKEDKQKALDFFKRAEEISIEISNDTLLKQIYFEKGRLLDYYEDYQKSVDIYKKALIYSLKTKDHLISAKCYLNIGATYSYYGDFDKALENYNYSYQQFSIINDSIYTPKVTNNIALIYKDKGDYIKAIDFFNKNLEIYKKNHNTKSEALTYFNIGVIYWEQKEYKKALQIFEETESIYAEIKDEYSLAEVYNNIALIYAATNDSIHALNYFKKAIENSEKTNNRYVLGTALMNVASIIDNGSNTNKVKEYYQKSLDIFRSLGYKKGEASLLLNLSILQFKQQQNEIALKNAKAGLQIATQIRAINFQIEAYEILVNIYNQRKAYNLSVESYKALLALKDSMFSIETNKQINEIIEKHESKRKQEKLELLELTNKNQRLIIEKAEHQNIILSIILIAVFILLSLIFYLYLSKQRDLKRRIADNIKTAKEDLLFEQLLKQKANEKYKDSTLNVEQKDKLINELANLLIEEKYFLKPNLTIDILANQLGTNKTYLSQVINEHYATNFNSFINEYRIKEARKMLITQDYNNYSLEGIASIVGFNNRASFITAFKKYTGVTPSVFQKNNKF